MHQSADVRVSAVLTVHIQDMRPIAERLAQRQIHVLNDIYRFACFVVIIFRDENNIAVRQFPVFLFLIQILHIQRTGVVSCPVRVSTVVGTLYLDVVLLSGVVRSVCVQTNRPCARHPF